MKKIIMTAALAFAVLASVNFASAAGFNYAGSLIKYGSVGSQVSDVQACMNGLGFTTGPVDGIYGPMTYAGITAFQATVPELTNDGIIGPLTAPFFEAACNGTDDPSSSSTPGCSAGDTYSSTTGEMCEAGDDGDNGDDNNGTIGGDEGDIENVTETAADESNIPEGDTEGIIAFEVEIEGDVSINRVDFYIEADDGSSYSDDVEDYFVEAILYVDGEEVASMDVDDFDKRDDTGMVPDNTNNDDEYRLRFSGLDLVFGDNDEPEFQLAFEVDDNLDSADLAGDWDVVMEGIRFVDGEGYSETDTTTITDSFGFDAEDIGELKISTSTNDPEGMVIEVDDADTTDDVEVFIFEIEEKNDVDVTIDDLTITITTLVETDEAVVVTEAKLFADGDEVDSQNVPTGGVVLFENINVDVDADDTVDFSVELSFADADDYAAGTTVSVTFTSITDAEDENGNDEVDMTITGAATSETHELREEGILVSLVDVDFMKSVVCDGGCAAGESEQGLATFTFDVEAIGADAYIMDAVDTDGAYLAGDGTVTDLTTGAATMVADMSVTGDADAGSTHYLIEEGTEGEVTVKVWVNPTAAGLFDLALLGIEWNDTDNFTTPVNYTLDLGDFETEALYLDWTA